jgi:hypothetical protein
MAFTEPALASPSARAPVATINPMPRVSNIALLSSRLFFIVFLLVAAALDPPNLVASEPRRSIPARDLLTNTPPAPRQWFSLWA